MAIKLIISDFDGTLADTFEANFNAYLHAFSNHGLTLTRDQYSNCFGMRFDDFMSRVGITDPEIRKSIRHDKGVCYPKFFHLLQANEPLLGFIRSFRRSGGKTALASTARRDNLLHALDYIDASDCFDFILAGEDVVCGKPNPEIYIKALQKANVGADEAIVFEDSQLGIEAACNAGINYISINKSFF